MPNSSGSLERRVNVFLDHMKISHSSTGYAFLMKAIIAVCEDDALRSARKVMPVYTLVADNFDVSPTRVEGRIRAVLKKAGCGMSGGQFIFWAADALYYAAAEEK